VQQRVMPMAEREERAREAYRRLDEAFDQLESLVSPSTHADVKRARQAAELAVAEAERCDFWSCNYHLIHGGKYMGRIRELHPTDKEEDRKVRDVLDRIVHLTLNAIEDLAKGCRCSLQ